ncbi:MAG: hypothetical protein DCC68_14530 [Planctomycetota bacterium]|nr:MAG: hypothetical protein DCC68_14530 [Planctomycetota bacterium]
MKRENSLQSFILFSALVAFGVVGRWLQPDWNFTPVAAVAGFAAFYFRSVAVSLLATFATLAVSNLLLPDYQSPGMMAAVYAAYCVPAVLGRWLGERRSLGRFAALCGTPAVAFYLTTNFAHWALLKQYEPTWDGLLACYAAGVPFFRGTLAGDVVYTVGVFGAYVVAMRWVEGRRFEPALVLPGNEG